MKIPWIYKAGIIWLSLMFYSSMLFAQKSSGKKLILHCDDLGVAHSVNLAAFELFEAGFISSASIMVPTPWFKEAAA